MNGGGDYVEGCLHHWSFLQKFLFVRFAENARRARIVVRRKHGLRDSLPAHLKS